MDCPEFRVLWACQDPEDSPVKTGPMDCRVQKVHLVQKVLKVIQDDTFLYKYFRNILNVLNDFRP
jgi:hypothetical protein